MIGYQYKIHKIHGSSKKNTSKYSKQLAGS
jgi:hypothetical protein